MNGCQVVFDFVFALRIIIKIRAFFYWTHQVYNIVQGVIGDS